MVNKLVQTAFGATRIRFVGLVLREATPLLAIVVTIGVGFAAWAGRTAASPPPSHSSP